MAEKLLAGVVAAVAIVPICAVCILGPVAIGSMFAALFAWFGGLGPVLATTLAIGVGIVTLGVFRRRRVRAVQRGPGGSVDSPTTYDYAEMNHQALTTEPVQRPSNSQFEPSNPVRGEQQ